VVTTIRAAISVVMLAGFYLLAVGIIGALAAATYWAFQEGVIGAAVGKLAYLTGAIALGLIVALWKVFRAKPEPPDGVALAPGEAPELFSTVADLAREVGTRAPDEIRLIGDVNAAVAEDSRLFGLIGGRRYLYLGLPLLQAFNVAQLRSVVAHELGHYSHSHTRLGALAHRGRMSIVATIVQIGPSSFAGRIFRAYAWLYVLVEQSVSRRQEYEADEASVRLAGRASATSAMRDLPIVDTAWNFYVHQYVRSGWEFGYAPMDIFGGFGHLLAGRAGELAEMRTEAAPSEKSRWDSHPPTADRIRAMQAMPEPAGVAVDDRPALALLPGVDALSARLQQETLAVEGKTLLPWDEFTAAATLTSGQREADVLFRVAGRMAGVASGSLGVALDLVAAGRGPELGAAVNPHGDESDALDALQTMLGIAIEIAGVKSGVATIRHSWSGPRELVDAAGVPLPVDEIAKLASAAPTAGEARERLAGLGIEVAAAVQESERASAVGAELLGAIANMKSGDAYYDVFVLDRGYVLVPGPKKADGGQRRLFGILQQLGSPAELAAKHRFISFEEIASAELVKKLPPRVHLTLHSGEKLPLYRGLTSETLDKDSDEAFFQGLAPFFQA
jgi:Zn-dependent protease with chaperone function